MPSDFVRSIFPRRLRHRDSDETFTSQAADQATEKIKHALQDPPPPYAAEDLAIKDDKKLPAKPSSTPSPTTKVSLQLDPVLSSSDSIRFCPHATSSFERIQRIVNLPDFKQSYIGIDALTPGPDHQNPFAPGFRLCMPDTGSNLHIGELSFPSDSF